MLRRPSRVRVLLVIALVGLAGLACAQVQISARVDRDIVSQDEIVELTVVVAGSGLGLGAEPTLPPLNGFDIAGTAQQQSISLSGGSMQTSMNYVYQLQPTRTGKLTIPAVTLRAGGRSYRTEAIAVTVLPGSGSGSSGSLLPPGANPFPGLSTAKAADVKHTVDHKTAYVGQQITYTFSFLQSEQLYGDVHYSPADTPGFVAEDLPNPAQSQQTLHGRVYSVQNRMKALFATAPGDHQIGQAGVTATLDPMAGPEELVADPITVRVLPLPAANRPPGFGGAVGQFTVRLRVDRAAVRAGETLNCVVDVTGTGNIRSLGAPELKVPAWVRVYKAGDNRTVRPGGGGGASSDVGGTASFTYMLLPRQAGTLRVGPVGFSYFDPDARAYRTVTSQSADVAVAPGSGAPTTVVVPVDSLRPIRTTLGHAPAGPLLAQRWLLVILALPLLAVLWSAWQHWQELRVLARPEQARAGNALTLAHRRFEAATRALAEGDRDGFYTQLHEAFLDYVADRTAAPPSGLTADVACDLLCAHGADEQLAQLARALLERTAAGRFAPGAGEPGKAEQLAIECRHTVAALQRQVTPDA